MQTNVADAIFKKVRSLPFEKQAEVLAFVDRLAAKKKNIWDQLEELMAEVPQEEMDELPVDASANIDHYLYGSPKK